MYNYLLDNLISSLVFIVSSSKFLRRYEALLLFYSKIKSIYLYRLRILVDKEIPYTSSRLRLY